MVHVDSDLNKALQRFVKWANKASSRIYYDSIIHIKTRKLTQSERAPLYGMSL